MFALSPLFLILLATDLIGQEPASDPQTQEQEEKTEAAKVTVMGQFVPPSMELPGFDIRTLKSRIVQIVDFRMPPVPENWKEMTPEQRKAWATEFENSAEGKALIETNKAIDAGRAIVELVIDDSGKFIDYDLPRGRFFLEAAVSVEADGKVYIVQTSRQFEIGEVDEVDLGKITLEAVRLLRMGDAAPGIAGTGNDGKPAALDDHKGKHVLLNFVVLDSPGFPALAKSISEAIRSTENAGKLVAFSAALDTDNAVIEKGVSENNVDWPCLAIGGWESKTLADYGVKTVPSLWLIDPEGKILLTGQQFVYELSRTGSTIGKLCEDVISGRLKIGENPAPQGQAGDDKK